MDERYRAFLAMPFRPELRWIRDAIRRATQELAIDLRSVDETLAPGREIVASIRHEIRSASLAYAVLTDLNPNVMYELGLLHEASKPTILLADPATLDKLPFDIRTRMVVSFHLEEKAADALTAAAITSTGRLLALFNPDERQKLAGASTAAESMDYVSVRLSIGGVDWEQIRKVATRAVNRKGCETQNISAHDHADFKGWILKARCMTGETIYVYVDLNGDIASIDVR